MDKPKYVAEGFEEDVTKVLAEFVEECSVEFVDFARIWKDNHFSLVFMGRPDLTETSEFTNEIFRITSHFLSSPSFYQKIGAVYLLYALYRNQIADPPIKIRIEMSHWKIIKDIFIDATSKKYKSLLYVIDYLIQYAFVFAANQTLRGPLIGPTKQLSKNFEVVSTMRNAYKADLTEYSVSNNLEALRDLHNEYLETKKNLSGHVNLSFNADNEVYQLFMSQVSRLANPPVRTKEEASENLGNRRAKIKAQSFLRKVKDRYGRIIEEDEDVDDTDDKRLSPVKRKTKNKRSPKKKGKVGRPSKKKIPEVEEEPQSNDDDDNVDITHLLEQQTELFLPPEDKNKKLKRYYYKLSPKREEPKDEFEN